MRSKLQLLGTVLGLLLSCQPALSDERLRLVGSWKLTALFTEDVHSGVRNHVYGEHPQGHLGITPGGRFFAFATADWRRFGVAPSEQIEFRSISYAGRYRLEGNKFILKTETVWNEGWEGTDPFDISWSEGWVGQEQVRYHSVEDAQSETPQLRMQTAPIVSPNGSGDIIIGTVIWRRE